MWHPGRVVLFHVEKTAQQKRRRQQERSVLRNAKEEARRGGRTHDLEMTTYE